MDWLDSRTSRLDFKVTVTRGQKVTILRITPFKIVLGSRDKIKT